MNNKIDSGKTFPGNTSFLWYSAREVIVIKNGVDILGHSEAMKNYGYFENNNSK